MSTTRSEVSNGISSPFDAMAAGYDDGFTHTPIGMLLRQAVWARLDVRFQPGQRILELNCGTGEDAVHLAQHGVSVFATDVSPAMVEMTRAKVAKSGFADRVTVDRLSLEDLGTDHMPEGEETLFDGALSNFGGLNCVGDWDRVADGLAQRLRPGAIAMLCVMGPHCPWEWAWYLRQGKPDKAFRRWKRGGTAWRGLTIRYPSIGQLRRAFAPRFRLLRASAVGVLIPPSYVSAWAERNPQRLAKLNTWERRIEAFPFVPTFGDHYLLELERVGEQRL